MPEEAAGCVLSRRGRECREDKTPRVPGEDGGTQGKIMGAGESRGPRDQEASAWTLTSPERWWDQGWRGGLSQEPGAGKDNGRDRLRSTAEA